MHNYTLTTLPNGLRLILVPDHSKGVVTTLAVFGVGSRYEDENEAGISHVLEHMFFKGTKNRPTSSLIAEFIEDIGGEHNAFTSKEYTGFYAKVASKHLAKSLDFVSDLLINPLFEEDDLSAEKPVILQELKMYEDLPMEVAGSKFELALLGDNSLGRDTIGTENSIAALTRADLIKYQKAHYTAANGVVVLAGNFGSFDDEEVKELVAKYFTFPAGQISNYPQITLNSQKALNVADKKTEQSNLFIGFRGAGFNNDDKYALKLLSIILGGSMSSRMFIEIREKLGLAYAVRTSSSSYQDVGVIETFAGVPHERVSEAIEAILHEYRRVFADLSRTEVERAKEIIYGRMLINAEDTSEVANHFALQAILGSKILTLEEIAKIYEKITLADIIKTGQKYLTDTNLALGFAGQNLTYEQAKKILKF